LSDAQVSLAGQECPFGFAVNPTAPARQIMPSRAHRIVSSLCDSPATGSAMKAFYSWVRGRNEEKSFRALRNETENRAFLRQFRMFHFAPCLRDNLEP